MNKEKYPSQSDGGLAYKEKSSTRSDEFFPTLTQLAAIEVFNIVYNIYFIIYEKKNSMFLF